MLPPKTRGRFFILWEGSTPFIQDFEDFIAFASAYDSQWGDANYLVCADTNDDGVVNFDDFINFAGSFGREAVGGAIVILCRCSRNDIRDAHLTYPNTDRPSTALSGMLTATCRRNG